MTTFDKVKEIVVEQLGVDEAEVSIDSTFIDDLGADSLDIVELIMAFEEEFNIEIVEKHHNQKKDAPSGTALLLADAVNDAVQTEKTYVYGRHGNDLENPLSELGIHAVRGGTIPGEHTVIYAGPDEVIELNHLALSRNIFASGAVKAAKYISKKTIGLYDMEKLIDES